MNTNSVTYLKISEFSQRIGVSPVTLRAWERRGWLLPHHRSPSGYRYYTEEQVQQYISRGTSDAEKGGGC